MAKLRGIQGMERHEQIDQLHQQAAAQYLQGEFDAAMESWRSLLSLDPEDERAREGLRLCEMLAEEGDGVLSPHSDIQAPAADRVDMGPEAVADPAPAWDLSAVGDEPSALPDPLSLDLDALDDSATAVDVGPAPSDAAIELESRVAELLAEARAARDGGNVEHALSVLSRVFILDEENAEAEALQAELQPAEESPDQNSPQGGEPLSADEAPILGDLDLAVSDEMDAAAGSETTPTAAPDFHAAPAAVPESQAVESVGQEPEPIAVGDASENPTEEPPLSFDGFEEHVPDSPVPSRVVAPRRSLPLKPIGIGVVALLALGGSFAAWKMFAGGEPAVGVETATTEAPGAGIEPPPAAETDAPAQPVAAESAATVPAVASEESVAEIIERASIAMERGDYTQAVVGFNQALSADPNNRLAREGLSVAGNYYREHKELIESIERAKAAFDNEDYRGALKIIYRLPENGGNQIQYDRWKTNGWFNLGVGALHGGNCTEAREHFGEARAMSPADPQVAASIELANECRQTPKPPGYFDRVAILEKRGLDD